MNEHFVNIKVDREERPDIDAIYMQATVAMTGSGGWSEPPKFPQPMTIEFLIRRSVSGNEEALKPVVHALNAMSRGGMYDVVGGGFAPYSVDHFWRVPHFEFSFSGTLCFCHSHSLHSSVYSPPFSRTRL